MLIFGFALVAGPSTDPQRRHLVQPLAAGSPERWRSCCSCRTCSGTFTSIFPFLELQENIRRDGRNVSLSFGSFFGQEMLAMLPLSAPIWLAGLWWLLRGRYRALGFAWLIAAAIIFAMNPRVYYLFPVRFHMLFAAGAVQIESWLARPRLAWIKPAYCALMVLMGFAPLAAHPAPLSCRPGERTSVTSRPHISHQPPH